MRLLFFYEYKNLHTICRRIIERTAYKLNALEEKMKKRDKAIKKKAEITDVPIFDSEGKVKKQKREVPKKTIIVLSIILVVLSIIYLPNFFIKDKNENQFIITPNVVGIKNASDYSKNTPDEDFDGDGFSNSLEKKYNTSQRRPDTDGDGVCDYAEVFITDTNPLKADDGLYKAVSKADAEAGKEVGSPYKIHNVVMWPDDIMSRVYGGLVRTRTGYRFCKFKGWAQFPEDGYAYKVKDGTHIALQHKEDENAWKIEDECEIVLSAEPLEMVHCFSIFGIGSYYIPDNVFGKILTAILPNNGIITCKKVAKTDTWMNANNSAVAPIVPINYDDKSLIRYGRNHNSLDDLAKVYASIDEQSSVLASLQSSEFGEVIVEVYGYTLDGNLYVANPDTLEPLGALTITERSERYMNEKGEIVYREWFEYSGLGFDSMQNNDRISFFAAAVDGNAFEEESSTTEPQTTEPQTDIEPTAPEESAAGENPESPTEPTEAPPEGSAPAEPVTEAYTAG